MSGDTKEGFEIATELVKYLKSLLPEPPGGPAETAAAVMPAPMSLDLRMRIVRAVESGSSIRQAARRFAVSPSAAIKLMQRVRTTGSAAPARYGRPSPPAPWTA